LLRNETRLLSICLRQRSEHDAKQDARSTVVETLLLRPHEIYRRYLLDEIQGTSVCFSCEGNTSGPQTITCPSSINKQARNTVPPTCRIRCVARTFSMILFCAFVAIPFRFDRIPMIFRFRTILLFRAKLVCSGCGVGGGRKFGLTDYLDSLQACVQSWILSHGQYEFRMKLICYWWVKCIGVMDQDRQPYSNSYYFSCSYDL